MDQFTRTELMIGPAGLARLRAAHVTVVGLGAVGSYAVEGLARAGVGHLKLIDFDRIQPSNINRQLYALHSTVGMAKAELARDRVRDINPACDVTALPLFMDEATMGEAIGDRPDVLVDAIDSLGPKVGLLRSAVAAELPCILSCMGAARRTRFADIAVADLAATHNCPLARLVRKRLHRHGITGGIRCVYSHELVDPDHPAVATAAETCARGHDRRPMGSLPTITGIFGLVLAHEAITAILGPKPWAATTPEESPS